MRSFTAHAIALATVFLAGCAAPIRSDLWQPLPSQIIVAHDTISETRGVGRFTIPAGVYRYWYQNKFGYFYANEDSDIGFEALQITGGTKTGHFKGGIVLSNREQSMIVYQLTAPSAAFEGKGELGSLAAWESGDKDGKFRQFRGVIPKVTADSFQLIR